MQGLVFASQMLNWWQMLVSNDGIRGLEKLTEDLLHPQPYTKA